MGDYLYKWDFIYTEGELRHWPEAPEGPDECPGGPAESIGYELVEQFALGDEDAGFGIEVYERPEDRDDLEQAFVLEWCLGAEMRLIFIADVGQLLQALRDYAPIAQAALASHQYRTARVTAAEPMQQFLAASHEAPNV